MIISTFNFKININVNTTLMIYKCGNMNTEHICYRVKLLEYQHTEALAKF